MGVDAGRNLPNERVESLQTILVENWLYNVALDLIAGISTEVSLVYDWGLSRLFVWWRSRC